MRKILTQVHLFKKWCLILMVLGLVAPSVVVQAQSCVTPAYNLDQGKNGPKTSPLNPIEWANGNLNASHSHFVEGYSVPYRAIISDLVAGQCYCILIEWDIKHSDVNALDYLTSYPNCTNTLLDDPSHQGSFMHNSECVDPLEDVGLVNPTMTTYPIPAPTNSVMSLGFLQPLTSFNAKADNEKKFTLWNGTITSVEFNEEGDLSDDQISSSMVVCFTADDDVAVLAWGGHIASRLEWGVGNSAGNISGSPYHMRILGAKCCNATAFSGGNQDRSLQAGAVTPAPIAIIAGVDTACAGSTNNHMLTTNQPGTTTYAWDLSDAGTTGAQIVGSTTAQSIEVSTTGAGEYIICGTVTINGVSGSICDTITVLDLPVCSISGDELVCNGNSTQFEASGGDSYLWSTGETTAAISVSLSGTYTVTVTNAFGCSSSCDKPLAAGAPYSLDFDATDVLCYGNETGSINLNVLGGGAGLSYSWSNGEITEDISGLAAGTYTVTVSDENGCSVTGSQEIEQPEAALNAGEIHIDASCYNGNDGSIDLTISGGTAPYTVNWSNNSTDEDLMNLEAGNYSVAVTDFFGCTTGLDVTIEAPAQLTIDHTQVNVACNGGNTGSIDITVSGGSPDYTYVWEDNSTDEDRTSLTSGNYTVTVTDDHGCTATDTYFISQAGSLEFDEEHANVLCNDGNSGSIDLTVSGGTPSYGYLWSDGSTDDDRSQLVAGVYTVTVSDANGCSVVESVEITEPAELTLSNQPGHVNCFDGNDGNIQLTVNGGTEPYSYEWSNGSSDEDVSGLVAGTYTVTVTDHNGCSVSESIQIDQPTELLITDHSLTHVLCNDGNTGSINITVEGGSPDYIFSWNNGADTEDISGLEAGIYDVNIADAHGCTAYMQFEITEPAALALDKEVTNIACNGANNGAVDLTVSGGTPEYSFEWSNGASSQNISGLDGGTYTVTVTDNNGCTASLSAEITEASDIVLIEQHENASCNQNNNGSINLGVMGGTPEYTYNWSNGESTEDITGLVAGTYTVTVTDVNQCSKLTSVEITEPSALVVNATGECSACKKQGEAYASVTASGGTGNLSFVWSTGETTEQISNLASGTYTVIVTDANGCTGSDEIVLDCDPQCQYKTFTMGGWGAGPQGNNPGVYLYSHFASAFPNGLSIGCLNTLTLTTPQAVTDFLPSTSQASLLPNGSLNNPGGSYSNVLAGQLVAASLSARFDVVDPAFSSEAGHLVDLIIGSGDFAGWSVAQLLDSANQYIGGCGSAYDAAQFNDALSALNETFDNGNVNLGYLLCPGEELQAEISSTDVSCDKVCDGTAEVVASYGTAPYSYLWSTGATTAAVDKLCEGTYTVTVTDGNGCMKVLSVLISKKNVQFNMNFVVTNISCPGAGNGMIDLTVLGGTAPYLYNWSNGETSEDINNLDATIYTVTVTDKFGCEATDAAQVTEPEAMVASVSKVRPVCGINGSIDLTVTGGEAPYSFVWSNGETTEDIGGLVPGYYTVTVTDNNGCSISYTTRMWGATAMKIKVVSLVHTSDKTCDGAIDIKINGGTPPFSYLWSNGATTQDISNLCYGVYKVTVTDAQGCTKAKAWRILYAKDVVDYKLAETPVYGSNAISQLSIYPTPANESATVRVQFENSGNADIKIINMLGKVEMEKTGIAIEEGVLSEVKLDVNHLSSGTYIVTVTQNGITAHEKLQIVK